MSSRQQGAERRFAGKVLAISQKRVEDNITGVIKISFEVFEISFGVLHFSAGKLGV